MGMSDDFTTIWVCTNFNVWPPWSGCNWKWIGPVFLLGGGGWIWTEAPSLTNKDRDMTTANTNQYQLLVISEEDAIFYAMEWGGVFFWAPFCIIQQWFNFPKWTWINNENHGLPPWTNLGSLGLLGASERARQQLVSRMARLPPVGPRNVAAWHLDAWRSTMAERGMRWLDHVKPRIKANYPLII